MVLAGKQEEHINSLRRLHKQKSYSDSDINSCEEFLSPSAGLGSRSRHHSGFSSHDSRLASLASSSESRGGLASSSNSMSFFGSESAIDLLNIRAEKIQSSLSNDLLNKMMHEKEEDGGSIDSGRDAVSLHSSNFSSLLR